MTDSDVDLSELEQDALTELLNIGVSRAASSLRKMVGAQVLLSVPAVEVVARRRAVELIAMREDSGLVAVHQEFAGDMSGRALLIFPEANSLELVRAVIGGDLELDDIIDLEQEALAEVGNIILNACMATVANQLKRKLRMSLPEIVRGRGPELFSVSDHGLTDYVLFLYIDFSVRERDIRGYIAVVLDLPSLATLQVLLREFIARVAGGGPTPAP